MDVPVVFEAATAAVMYVPTIFRASAIAILFLYGWALNVAGFDRFKIPFRKVLNLNTGAQYEDIIAGVRMLLLVLIVCFMLYKVSIFYNYGPGETVTQVAFWLSLVALSSFSQQKVFRGFRKFLAHRLRTFFTFSSVTFVDVLTADALTSMSKLLADLQVVLCAHVALFTFDPSLGAECMHSLVGPSLASLPYAIRAVQCYKAYLDTKSTHNLINLGKYLSAFPVIWTSALKHQLAPLEGVALDEHDHHLQILWLYCVTINTLYSFFWDVLMDWGLARNPNAKYPLLRNEMLYKSPALYYTAIAMDLALRLCWSLKLSSHLQSKASGLAFVFLFEVLEVFRRFVWNFFRVEWQCIQTKLMTVPADEK
eukprot:TRINITY_DN6768_c0_g1_i1.p1 TRINITY_DN6768_c0_g1~~TRINITY_DN6768_c0_g1_i1.p1  ORF type:complete len:367 (+),score=55.80 TRINITY_DN6768_c0_g1_i1:165-1265(+)